MGDQHDPSRLSREAFARIVDRHQRALHSFALGLTRNPETARDVVQDTFADAWRATQHGAAPFVAGGDEIDVRRWLFHTTYCRAVTLLRRGRIIRWEPLTDDFDAPDGADSFDELLAESEALRLALDKLSPPDVALLILRVVHGFSIAEIATIVGASPTVVTKRLSRAKQRLRAAYLTLNTSHDAMRAMAPEEQRLP